MHYYKRNLGDYAKKAGRLSMLQHGSYTLLIDACYDREQFPTLEDAIEWCWASSEEEIAAVKFVLGKFFDLVDGRYHDQRIASDIEVWKARGWIPVDPRVYQPRPPSTNGRQRGCASLPATITPAPTADSVVANWSAITFIRCRVAALTKTVI